MTRTSARDSHGFDVFQARTGGHFLVWGWTYEIVPDQASRIGSLHRAEAVRQLRRVGEDEFSGSRGSSKTRMGLGDGRMTGQRWMDLRGVLWRKTAAGH